MDTLFKEPHDSFKQLFQEAYTKEGSQYYTAFHAFLKQDAGDPYTIGLKACESYKPKEPFDFKHFEQHLYMALRQTTQNLYDKREIMEQLTCAYNILERNKIANFFFDQAKSFFNQHRFKQFVFDL